MLTAFNCMQLRKVINIFYKDPTVVTTYMALSNNNIQQDWLHGPKVLGDWDDELRPMGPFKYVDFWTEFHHCCQSVVLSTWSLFAVVVMSPLFKQMLSQVV